MTSIVYRSQMVYEIAMLLIYRQHYHARYRAIADLIPTGAKVLDLCCGPAVLFTRYLAQKNVVYTGLDRNERFVAAGSAKRVRMILGDLSELTQLPAAEFVIMQGSLYHFLPDRVSAVIDKMLAASKQKVIIAEPVRNLSASRMSWLAILARHQSNAGYGPSVFRFDARSLATALAPFAAVVERSFPIAGGREMVYVLRGLRTG
jgi:trans-aconitate methyltransferase